jgi:hypothetical protein
MTSAHWTGETDRAADALFRTFSVPEIRRRQDLASQQINRAYAMRDRDPARAELALTDLTRMQDALTREMLRRTETTEQEG